MKSIEQVRKTSKETQKLITHKVDKYIENSIDEAANNGKTSVKNESWSIPLQGVLKQYREAGYDIDSWYNGAFISWN